MPENTIGVPSPEEIETPVMVDGESVHLSASTIVLEAEELLEEEQSGLTIVEDIEEEADASASDEFTDIQE